MASLIGESASKYSQNVTRSIDTIIQLRKMTDSGDNQALSKLMRSDACSFAFKNLHEFFLGHSGCIPGIRTNLACINARLVEVEESLSDTPEHQSERMDLERAVQNARGVIAVLDKEYDEAIRFIDHALDVAFQSPERLKEFFNNSAQQEAYFNSIMQSLSDHDFHGNYLIAGHLIRLREQLDKLGYPLVEGLTKSLAMFGASPISKEVHATNAYYGLVISKGFSALNSALDALNKGLPTSSRPRQRKISVKTYISAFCKYVFDRNPPGSYLIRNSTTLGNSDVYDIFNYVRSSDPGHGELFVQDKRTGKWHKAFPQPCAKEWASKSRIEQEAYLKSHTQVKSTVGVRFVVSNEPFDTLRELLGSFDGTAVPATVSETDLDAFLLPDAESRREELFKKIQDFYDQDDTHIGA